MPEYIAPGVYVEESSFRNKSIAGVSTSVAAFVGYTRRGPLATAKLPGELTSFTEFEQRFGGLTALSFPPKINYLAHAVRSFFDEGGRRLVVARVRSPRRSRPTTVEDWQQTLDVLTKVKNVSIVAAPGSTELGSLAAPIQARVIAHVNPPNNYRFAVLDIPSGKSVADAISYRARFDSRSAAFYYPWVTVTNPHGRADAPATLNLSPSGFISGIYARTDAERGVFKAPANEIVRTAVGFERGITTGQQEILNPAGVNCLRYFQNRGFRVWGARTASADPEWKYINLRRYFIYLEQSIDLGTQWAVFEPNGERLWANVRASIVDFLHNEWKSGALPGVKPEQAFYVRCDRSTMTQSDLDNGRLVCQIGVAAIKPAEFVVFCIGQWTADRKP